MKLALQTAILTYLIAMKMSTRRLKASLMVIAFAFLGQQSFAQASIFELTPKANAFMCPFLTPIFMQELTEAGAQELRKDESLVIHFKVPQSAALDSLTIYRIAGEVGFQSTIFTLKKTEE